MTLQEAKIKAYEQAIVDFGYHELPDLDNRNSTERHEAKMKELNALLAQVEAEVEASFVKEHMPVLNKLRNKREAN